MPTAEARIERGEIFTEQRINQIGLAGLSLSFVLLTIAFVFIFSTFRAAERAAAMVSHTYEVKETAVGLGRSIERAEAATRGFLLSPESGRRGTFESSIRDVEDRLDRLTVLSSDNFEQRERVASLRPLIEAEMRELDDYVRLVANGGVDLARDQFAERDAAALRNLTQIRSEIERFEAIETALLEQRAQAERRTNGTVQMLLATVALALLVTALGTIWVLRRQLNAVFISRAQLAGLNASLESVVNERTADLRRANEEIQRFAYIVSHDLRSPLVNVMGFTAELEGSSRQLEDHIAQLEKERPDLLSRDAVLAIREDLPEAIGFIRTSTQKMDRLINAILDLSRQGRRVLAPAPLDMNALLDEVAGTMATLAEERDAQILVRPLPALVHDRIAVEQIFTNLIENALKYLRPGVPGRIEVRGSESGGKAVFEIEDNGRGIKANDLGRIFELFRRSGEQDQRGEGIGLANVRALAYRLGGTVEVRSQFGEGSVFTVTLPTEFVDEGTADG